ncbi:hypothetical protein OG216_05575 [Streptomycetaceae bacterium NBC_01309]
MCRSSATRGRWPGISGNTAGLTATEERVRAAWRDGHAAVLGPERIASAAASGASWGAERTVRGSALRTLVAEAAEHGSPSAALSLCGARIVGVADLGALDLPFGLVLEGAYLD